MLVGSLSQSYSSYLSAITTTLSVLGTKLTPDALMLSIIDEFDCCTIKTHQSKDKGKDVAFHAVSGSKKPWKGGKGLKKSVKCFNCHRKGHVLDERGREGRAKTAREEGQEEQEAKW